LNIANTTQEEKFSQISPLVVRIYQNGANQKKEGLVGAGGASVTALDRSLESFICFHFVKLQVFGRR
jgi:hypothetical protein